MTRKKKTTVQEVKKPEEYQVRMMDEFKQLYQRGNKLAAFMDKNPRFKSLCNAEKYDMQCQMMAMSDYINALMRRLRRAGLYDQVMAEIKEELESRKEDQALKLDEEEKETTDDNTKDQ